MSTRSGRYQAWIESALLFQLALIPGVYVPSLYSVSYLPDGTSTGDQTGQWRCCLPDHQADHGKIATSGHTGSSCHTSRSFMTGWQLRSCAAAPAAAVSAMPG